MKLYQKETMKVIRLDIKEFEDTRSKKATKARGITLQDTTIAEAVKYVEKLFKDVEVTIKLKATQRPSYSTITAYEAIGQKRGNYKSITLYGMTADKIYDMITKSLS